MRRHAQAAKAIQPRVRVVIQGVGEQSRDFVAAENAGRQADVVHDQQRDVVWTRPVVVIGRRDVLHAGRRLKPAMAIQGQRVHLFVPSLAWSWLNQIRPSAMSAYERGRWMPEDSHRTIRAGGCFYASRRLTGAASLLGTQS